MKVIQQDIAERLSLSVSTVSRALRNDNAILPATRAKVFQTANDLGYRVKNKRGQNPAGSDKTTTGPAQVIGVYAHEPTKGSWTSSGSRAAGHSMLSGISAAAARLGVQIHFQSVREGEIETILSGSRRNATASRLRVHECSGALLMYMHQPSAVQQLTQHFPCVSLVNRYAVGDLDTVGIDSDRSIGELVRRLLEHGHRRIGFFSVKPRRSWVEDRFASYVKALMHHRIDFDPRLALGVNHKQHTSLEQSTQAMCEATRGGVTAWVCSQDHAGYHACKGLRNAGFDVPGDVSVVGFDGVAPPEGMPPLSTVVSPLEELGEAGVTRVLSRIKEPTMSTRTVLLKCRIREGQTIGKAPTGAAYRPQTIQPS